MHFIDRHREKIRQSPMSSRLLWASLLLVVLLVFTFGAALFLFASLHNTKKDISRSLQIQFSVFQNNMERYFDQLAVMSVNLSEDMSAEVDKELALRQMSFAQLNDSPEVQFEEDRRESRRRMEELQLERQQMQTALTRLANACRNESVSESFQTFVDGIPTLTNTERRIFDGYVAGLRSREIVEQLDIKDSTLRYHNKNIYNKLGVTSLKELQQFVAILNSGSGSAPDSAPDEK